MQSNSSKKIFNTGNVIITLAVLILISFILLIILTYTCFIPKKFAKEISLYANEFSVDEDLAYAVIRAESGFKKNAVSSAGAIGLMQLMPETANYIWKKLEGESVQDLFNVKVNLRIGIYYLSYLSQKFSDIDTVLSAYNAGEGNVSEWLKDDRYSDDGKTLKGIPFSETKNYVKKVKKFYKCYKILYI